jgi:hypothetical protein
VAGSSMGNWLVRTRGRGAGEERFGGRRPDRRVPPVTDGDAVTGWQAGSRTKMGRGQRRAGPVTEKAAHDDFFNLNPFSN